LILYNIATQRRSGPLGDLSHPIFFVLTIVNACFLLFPSPPRSHSLSPHTPQWNILLFFARLSTYPFTLFFFFLLIPLLPLSWVLLLYFGIGLPMMAPSFLLGVHTWQLLEDWKHIRPQLSLLKCSALVVAGLSLLPLLTTSSFFYDRMVLHRALRQLYRTPYEPVSSVSQGQMKRILRYDNSLRPKMRQLHGVTPPLLSRLYQSIVFNQGLLPKSKRAHLEKVFLSTRNHNRTLKKSSQPSTFPKHPEDPYKLLYTQTSASTRPRTAYSCDDTHPVKIIDLHTKTIWDPQIKSFRSKVHLELQSFACHERMSEFAQTFSIPQGVWISSYFLRIKGKDVVGALTERGSTLWLYRQVLRRQRDPGLLYYTAQRNLRLRVFPFLRNQVRHTGFTILHPNPFVLRIGKYKRALALPQSHPTRQLQTFHTPTGPAIYITGQTKQELPKLIRKRHVHLIVDRSRYAARSDTWRNEVQWWISRVHQRDPNAKLTLTYANLRTQSHSCDQGRQCLQSPPSREGVFLLERTIQNLMHKYHLPARHAHRHPIFLIYSDAPNNSLFSPSLYRLKFYIPECSAIYFFHPPSKKGALKSTPHPTPSAKIWAYPLQGQAIYPTNFNNVFRPKQVYAWPDARHPKAYFSNDRRDEIRQVLTTPNTTSPSRPPHRPSLWEQGAQLYVAHQRAWLAKHPQQAWLTQIRQSWSTKLLSPVTSFSVFETQAQWNRLKQRQRQVLSGKTFLQVQTIRMDEPTLWPFLLLLLLVWVAHKIRSAQQQLTG
ncbi:MAG: MSEP-CTERM sorting domain-containing protein, partial [Myxococcota bacterium]